VHVAEAADEDPIGPNLPAAQGVPEQLEAPAGEWVPAAQLVHVAIKVALAADE
jgi:hypothetical protein